VSRLGDRLFETECDLARNEGGGEGAALSRRIALRNALTAWGDERFQEGYHEGRRDAVDARIEAQRRAEARADEATDAEAAAATGEE
jgi:hypothetical protein